MEGLLLDCNGLLEEDLNMSAGKYRFRVQSKMAPVVELDSNAQAAYIRFSKAKVASTEVLACDREVITADLSKKGDLIGLELVGVDEFTLSALLKACRVQAPKSLVDRARYFRAKPASREMACVSN
jgi:uncharacterized protein YuzE